MSFILKTNRLLLRDFSSEDIDSYIAITSDEKYQRFYNHEDCSPEKSRKLVEDFVKQISEQPRTKYQLAITLKDTQKFIGTCGLRIEPDRQASIGCGVARSYQTYGYASEAMSSLVNYGFEQHQVHRIYTETIESNKPAVDLCIKFGMRVEAKFIQHRYFKQKWWNTIVLAMLRSEWQHRNSHNKLNQAGTH